MKTALTIAGSDSSGGAGIQADIKTMTANGVYATSAITALTAQNTTGVYGILESTPEFLANQLDCVFTDIFPDAVKTGMVSSIPLIRVIAAKLKEYGAKNLVVDPVMGDHGRAYRTCTPELCARMGELAAQAVSGDPELALSMMKYLARTVRLLSEQLDAMAFRPAEWRIARYLLSHSPSGGTVQCTQEDIAAAVSVSRVTVSRILNRWAHSGTVALQYRSILLRDPSALEQLCRD